MPTLAESDSNWQRRLQQTDQQKGSSEVHLGFEVLDDSVGGL
jgi:hypothetical protein